MEPDRSLRVRSFQRGPIGYLELSGVIDETFDPGVLATEAPKIVLDLSGVTRLTPFGAREWTRALRTLGLRAETIYLVRVSPAFVGPLATIGNFSAGARLVSLRLAFDCERCGAQRTYLWTVDAARTPVLPAPKCERCGVAFRPASDGEAIRAIARAQPSDLQPLDFAVAAFLRQIAEGPPPEPTEPAAPLRAKSFLAAVPTAGSRLRSTLVGIAIPLVVGAAIAVAWPDGEALPAQDRGRFEQDLSAGRYAEARALLQAPNRATRVSTAKIRELEARLTTRALAQYGQWLAASRFEQAARLLNSLARDQVITTADAKRLQREIGKAALGRYRQFLSLRQFAEAEATVRPLEAPQVLAAEPGQEFTRDLSRERERAVAALHREVQRAFENEQWTETVASARELAVFGPLPLDVQDRVGTAQRHLGLDSGEASAGPR